MKKFEIGTQKTTVGTFETTYCIEKVTAKTVTVTIHKGGRYEKTRRCKIVDNGKNQYCEAFGLFLESDDEKFEIA